jgi:hypothetical protein
VEPGAIAQLIESAQRERRGLRLHLHDGEVVTLRVLDWDGAAVLYAPLTSSHPERYAVCDSTGYSVPLDAIERAQLMR